MSDNPDGNAADVEIFGSGRNSFSQRILDINIPKLIDDVGSPSKISYMSAAEFVDSMIGSDMRTELCEIISFVSTQIGIFSQLSEADKENLRHLRRANIYIEYQFAFVVGSVFSTEFERERIVAGLIEYRAEKLLEYRDSIVRLFDQIGR